LVIYTYSDLFSYPYINISREFEIAMGLDEGAVLLIGIGDDNLPNTILNPNLDPMPDVVIGIDNVEDLGVPPSTFMPISPPALANISSALYAHMSPFNLIPYEYARITIIANTSRIAGTYDPTTVTLQNFLSSTDMLKKFIVENPLTEETGVGFMLATIATFGDPEVGVEGQIPGQNWRDWWSVVLKYATVVSTWDEGFALFQEDEPAYELLVSWELDPTYFFCTENQTEIVELDLSQDEWYIVEGIGLFNKSTNQELAAQFIEWFLSGEIQTQIPLHEWAYPAKNNVTLPECFKGKYVSPDPSFNERLNKTTLLQFLPKWINDWNVILNTSRSTTTSATNHLVVPLLFVLLAVVGIVVV